MYSWFLFIGALRGCCLTIMREARDFSRDHCLCTIYKPIHIIVRSGNTEMTAKHVFQSGMGVFDALDFFGLHAGRFQELPESATS